VARTDRGIRQWSDLKGKKVGLTAGTVTEFFLDRALTFNKLSRDDVELVHLEPLKSVEALRNNHADAIVVWSRLDDSAQEDLGGNVVSWSVQFGKDYYWVLVCKSELTSKRPRAIKRLLAALAFSEGLVASNRDEAQRIVSRRSSLHQSVDNKWPHHNLRVSPDQKMILAMEDAARWFSLKGSSKDKTPNFLNFIYFDGLETVKPVAISVIH
jgi:ABC-type nitrate/sulfonate/bicarbonate transport system substrate-binding protein